MKKLLLISFVFLSFVSFGQIQGDNRDEYYREIDWKFIPDDVVQLTDSTYSVKAVPIDFNDPGAIERKIGNYIVDFVGHRYLVTDSISQYVLEIQDEYKIGQAPQTGRIARCYKSVGDGKASYVGSVDYSPLDESVRWKLNGADNELLWDELGQPYDSILFNKNVSPIPSTPYAMYADTTDRTISVNLGNGVVMQINQETLIRVYNDTPDTISDGRVCFGSGINGDAITIALASKADRHSALVMTTEAIPPNHYGLCVELAGRVRGVLVGAATPGPIYLDTMGYVSNSQGVFPDYNYPLGAIIQKNGTAVIQFRASDVSFRNSIDNIMDGAIRETFDFRTFSDGVTTQGVISNPTGDTTLTLVFSTGWYDFTVPDTVTMIDGAIDAPQLNYVYIDEATRTLQVNSGSYPTAEHAKVSTSALLTSTQTQSDGALRNQNINDHFKSDNDNGHILHIAERIRVLNAAWESGVAATLTGTPSNVYIITTGGTVWQMHLQSFPAQDMSSGDDIHVVNDFTTPYRTTTNLNDISDYSDGSNWNNEWSNIVVWGVCNKSGEVSHIMVNLPSDGYSSESLATEDRSNYTDYTIPREFRGVGFLIARFTIRVSPGGTTYNPSVGFLDLRGSIPNNTAGGGTGGGGGNTEWTQDTDVPNSYAGFGEAIVTIASAETGAEFTPRGNIPLTDFDPAGFTAPTSSDLQDVTDNGNSTTNTIRSPRYETTTYSNSAFESNLSGSLLALTDGGNSISAIMRGYSRSYLLNPLIVGGLDDDPSPYTLKVNGLFNMNTSTSQVDVTENAGGTNIVMGFIDNTITTGTNVRSNTISGGGFTGLTNRINGDETRYATIGGGYDNYIQGAASTDPIDGAASTIAGGAHHLIQSSHSVIGGGSFDTIFVGAEYATIAGGQFNNVTASYGSVVGGLNTTAGEYAVAGGFDNTASGFGSTVFGRGNTVTNLYSTAIGISNTVSGERSFAFNFGNTVSGDYSGAIGREINISGSNSFGIALNDQNGNEVTQSNTLAILGGRVGIGQKSPDDQLHLLDGNLRIQSTIPTVRWKEDGITNQNWVTRVNGGDFLFLTGNDDFSSLVTEITIKQNGNTLFGTETDNSLGVIQANGGVYAYGDVLGDGFEHIDYTNSEWRTNTSGSYMWFVDNTNTVTGTIRGYLRSWLSAPLTLGGTDASPGIYQFVVNGKGNFTDVASGVAAVGSNDFVIKSQLDAANLWTDYPSFDFILANNERAVFAGNTSGAIYIRSDDTLDELGNIGIDWDGSDYPMITLNADLLLATMEMETRFDEAVRMPILVENPSDTVNLDASYHTYVLDESTDASLVINLPTASTCNGRIYVIVNRDSQSHTISSYETISAGSTSVVLPNASTTIQSNGILWYQIH